MMLNKCAYCLRSALQNMRRNFVLNLLAVTTIAATFLVFISFFLVVLNIASFKQTWAERLQVIVFFSPAVTEAAAARGAETVSRMPETAAARLVSRREALAFLRTSLQGRDGLLDGLDHNPLPHSIEITLRPRNADIRTPGFQGFIKRLESLDGVADIEYGEKWLDRHSLLIDALTLVGTCLTLLFFLFTLLIIANTIRLMVYMRRDEIEIMRLVGATSRFIKTPFCFEGIIQGLSGAAAAVLLCAAAQGPLLEQLAAFARPYIGVLHPVGIDGAICLCMLALGALLGLSGSLLSVASLNELQR